MDDIGDSTELLNSKIIGLVLIFNDIRRLRKITHTSIFIASRMQLGK